MSEWKKVKIDFATIKLGDYIEPIKTTVADTGDKNPIVYGVSNKDGISQTGKSASKDISNYIVLEKDCFAFNPYRINVGSIGVNDENLKGCVSPAYVVFKTKNGLLPKFLYFYLKSDYGIHLINWYGNRGGVRNALRYSDLCKIDIPDIRHLNQEKLLKTFSSAWTQIEELNKEIEKQKNYAKQLRQNILQEAIEGKLTADWRKQHPVQKGNPDYDAQALFEKIQAEKSETKSSKKTVAPITKDEIPFEIPTNWKWIRLGDVGEIYRGTGIKKSDMVESGLPCVRYGELYTTYGLIFSDAKSFIKKDLFDKSKKFGSKSVIFTLTGENRQDIAKAAAYLGDNLVAASGDLAFWTNHSQEPRYLSFYMASLYFTNIKKKIATGDFIIHMSVERIKNVPLPLPPLAEQKEIVARVEQHLQTIAQLEIQIATRETTTKQLMQSILKDAFEEG